MPYEVKNVVILRDGTGYFRGIKMTRSDGNKGTLTDESKINVSQIMIVGRLTLRVSD